MSNEVLSIIPFVKNSNLGRASLIVWLVFFLSMFLLIVGGNVVSEFPAIQPTNPKIIIGLVLLMVAYIYIICPLGYLVGLLFGLIDLFKNKQKKAVTISGIILNGMFFLLLIVQDILFFKTIFEFVGYLD